jgi:hypothetical protein
MQVLTTPTSPIRNCPTPRISHLRTRNRLLHDPPAPLSAPDPSNPQPPPGTESQTHNCPTPQPDPISKPTPGTPHNPLQHPPPEHCNPHPPPEPASPLPRVSFETSFDSKQPKLEPKLVSALSETKRLFRLFRFKTETESFDVSIEPKQTGDQPKQFDREHICYFYRKFRVFPIFSIFSVFFSDFFGFFGFFFFSVFFGLFRNSFFGCFASISKQRVSIEPKQTEDPPKQFKREIPVIQFI